MTNHISMGRHDVLMNRVLSCLTALGVDAREAKYGWNSYSWCELWEKLVQWELK